MFRRMAGIYFLCIMLLGAMMFRVYDLSRGEMLAQAAHRQSGYTLEVAEVRGGIYDCNLLPLVNSQTHAVAAVLPTPESAAALLEGAGKERRELLLAQLEGGKPFLTPLEDPHVYAEGVRVFTLPDRYAQNQTAVHVIGYLNGEGGVTGLERAYDELLREEGGQILARYQIDAAGQAFRAGDVSVSGPVQEHLGGVVLTLDRRIQQAAEQAMARGGIAQGAVVVMEAATGDIKAMASVPAYDPTDVAAVLEDESGPLLNRALCAYNVGSTFKLAVAAAALEQGVSRHTTYDCPGWAEVDGQVYRCHNWAGHGEVDMTEAIQHSCNVYFIKLGQELGGEPVRELAAGCGLGAGVKLAEGLSGQAGLLTESEYLASSGELANFSFGQGRLTATPLQLAQLVSAIANGGSGVTPRLVAGTTSDGLTLTAEAEGYAQNPVMGSVTAALLRGMMVDTVEQGSGAKALPAEGGAGGKTASAQTGRLDERGDEIVHAWFCGFYPADTPVYSIVVLAEGGDSGGDVAAPVFRDIADAIAALN